MEKKYKLKNNKNVPTYKEERFAEKYVENGGNATQAVLETYNAKDARSASVIGSQNLAKVRIQRRIKEILEQKGITEELIAEQMRKALIENPSKDISWSEKHAYIETALKLKGYLKNKEEQEPMRVAFIVNK